MGNKITRTTQADNGKFDIVTTYDIDSNRYWSNMVLNGHDVGLSFANISESQAKAIHDLYRLVNGLDKQPNQANFD